MFDLIFKPFDDVYNSVDRDIDAALDRRKLVGRGSARDYMTAYIDLRVTLSARILGVKYAGVCALGALAEAKKPVTAFRDEAVEAANGAGNGSLAEFIVNGPAKAHAAMYAVYKWYSKLAVNVQAYEEAMVDLVALNEAWADEAPGFADNAWRRAAHAEKDATNALVAPGAKFDGVFGAFELSLWSAGKNVFSLFDDVTDKVNRLVSVANEGSRAMKELTSVG